MPNIQQTTRFEEHDISESGVVGVVPVPRRPLVSVNIDATATASYAVDVGPDRETWFENETTYDDTDTVRDMFEVGDAFIRIRVTDNAAAGETADIIIQEAR